MEGLVGGSGEVAVAVAVVVIDEVAGEEEVRRDLDAAPRPMDGDGYWKLMSRFASLLRCLQAGKRAQCCRSVRSVAPQLEFLV